jgi:probable HAF family extracellular repeat protein
MKGLARGLWVCACAAVAAAGWGQVKYSLVDLGTLGGSGSQAYALNLSGQVAGISDMPGNATQHAFLYSGGKMIDLGTLSGRTLSCAYGINDLGQVVGSSYNYSSGEIIDDHAFLYSSGSLTDLGTLGGGGSDAFGIDDSGRIVGQSYATSIFEQAFVYSDGVMSNLGNLGGPWGSCAYAALSSGQIVGVSFTGSADQHAFLYSGGAMKDLGTLGGSTSIAFGVNSRGQVAGWSNTAGDGAQHAFLYSNGSMADLGTVSGGTWSEASGVNSGGQVVGWGTGGAFVYANGTMALLDDLLDSSGANWTVLQAAAINDCGQIVGYAYNSSTGVQHAVLLTPDAGLKGTVTLQDFEGDVTAVPVVVEIRSPGTTTVLQRQTITLSAGGSFSIVSSLVGTYDVAAKASHWLRKTIRNVVFTGNGYVGGLSFSLINGDVNGDNVINLADLDAIAEAWHSTPGAKNWNANADLNGDGTVNLEDWDIAARNWRLAGDR